MKLTTRIGAWLAILIAAIVVAIVALVSPAQACGGFFCDNDPVDQTAERILFTVNPDETITSLIEIQYQGSAEDFSWILPIPSAIDADAVQVPEDGDLVFDELHDITDVIIRQPELPECAREELLSFGEAEEAMEDEAGVEVFASGEVGPFGFDVIGSEDSNAVVNWLLDRNYRVDPPMEPLIDVYVEEQFAFIAMRLLDGETSDSISPIELTYAGTEPMIPLRLTAVAALPNMPIFTWFFADDQVVPDSFAHMEIETAEITFDSSGGNDYTRLVQLRADELDGQAFVTEYAQPSDPARFDHPYLVNNAESSAYLTRLTTYISPDEMTLDPTFTVSSDRSDVSRIRDASDMTGLYDCERRAALETGSDVDAIDPTDGTDSVAVAPAEIVDSSGSGTDWTLPILALGAVALFGAFAYQVGARSRS